MMNTRMMLVVFGCINIDMCHLRCPRVFLSASNSRFKKKTFQYLVYPVNYWSAPGECLRHQSISQIAQRLMFSQLSHPKWAWYFPLSLFLLLNVHWSKSSVHFKIKIWFWLFTWCGGMAIQSHLSTHHITLINRCGPKINFLFFLLWKGIDFPLWSLPMCCTLLCT